MVPTIWRTGPWPQGWPDQPVIGTKKPVSQIASGAAKDRLASPKFHASSMHQHPPGAPSLLGLAQRAKPGPQPAQHANHQSSVETAMS